MSTADPLHATKRAQAMQAVLGLSDAERDLIRVSTGALVERVGKLMEAIRASLMLRGEEYWFENDPELAEAFGDQLAHFIMKATAGTFDHEYCDFAAGFVHRLPKVPPPSVFVAMIAVIGEWLAHALAEIYNGDRERLGSALAAWHKLLVINLELLLTPYRVGTGTLHGDT